MENLEIKVNEIINRELSIANKEYYSVCDAFLIATEIYQSLNVPCYIYINEGTGEYEYTWNPFDKYVSDFDSTDQFSLSTSYDDSGAYIYLELTEEMIAKIQNEKAQAARNLCVPEFSDFFWHHGLNAYSGHAQPRHKLHDLQNLCADNPEAEICVMEDDFTAGTFGVGFKGTITALFSRDIWSYINEDGTRRVGTADEYEIVSSLDQFLEIKGKDCYKEGFITNAKIVYLWYNDDASDFVVKEIKRLAKYYDIPYFNADDYFFVEDRDKYCVDGDSFFYEDEDYSEYE